MLFPSHRCVTSSCLISMTASGVYSTQMVFVSCFHDKPLHSSELAEESELSLADTLEETQSESSPRSQIEYNRSSLGDNSQLHRWKSNKDG